MPYIVIVTIVGSDILHFVDGQIPVVNFTATDITHYYDYRSTSGWNHYFIGIGA